jgi:flagellar biosynthesis/type III secretory pathway ATPase
MMNLGGPAALLPNAPVRPIGPPGEAEVGAALLGRVVDGAGKPIDGLGPIRGAGKWPLAGKLQSPLDRGRVLSRWTSACARSTGCSPSARASASASWPARASANRCCSA